MEIINFNEDIQVYYVEADFFPENILEAHQKLHQGVTYSKERKYFDLSRPEKGVIHYKAAAEKLETDEREGISFPTMILPKGKYRSITIEDYMKDIEGIGKAFTELTSGRDIDPEGYCVEWYYNEDDVKCMIRLQDEQ